MLCRSAWESGVTKVTSPRPIQAVVIGSGAGGAVTALELARAGVETLILEEGTRVELPDGFDKGSPEAMKLLYRRRGMTPILGRVPIGYVEGASFGGSTEINSGFWHRTPPEVLLRWHAQYGLSDADVGELAPHFDWAESTLGVSRSNEPLPENSRLLAKGVESMGWSSMEVPRVGPAEPTEQIPAPRTLRKAMSRSVLPAAERAGAKVLTRCRAKMLIRERRRITGVLAEIRNTDGTRQLVRVPADHVFVCAGATETPALLRRSGIRHRVGDTFRCHPMLKVTARFPGIVDSTESALPLLQIKEFWPEITMGGAFFTLGHLALMLADNWGENEVRMQEHRHLAAYYVAVRGTGEGTIRSSLAGEDTTAIRYQLSEQDVRNLSQGLARLAMVLLAAGAEEVYPAIRGLPVIRREVEAARWLDHLLPRRALSLTTVHAFSACPMGERRDRCAADSFGNVHHYENLHIHDVSGLPDSPGVNPQGTVMAFARRNTLHFLAKQP